MTGFSVLASLPVSALPAAVAAAVTADIVAYFAHILIVVQKLAYLYGFEDFALGKDEIAREAMDQIMVFLGVMFSIRGSGPALEEAAGVVARKNSKAYREKAGEAGPESSGNRKDDRENRGQTDKPDDCGRRCHCPAVHGRHCLGDPDVCPV